LKTDFQSVYGGSSNSSGEDFCTEDDDQTFSVFLNELCYNPCQNMMLNSNFYEDQSSFEAKDHKSFM